MTTEVAEIAVEATIPDRMMAEMLQAIQSRQPTTDLAYVRAVVEREWARYDDARVRTFVPLLVQRAVVDQILSAHCAE